MKLLILSDKESNYLWEHYDNVTFQNIDLIISCGDLNSKYLSFLVTVFKAPLFYVHGNHDTNYIEFPPEGCDSIEDKIVNYKGLRILGLGGTQKYNISEFQYTEAQMNKRAKKLNRQIRKNKGFDILVTHAPAYKINDGEDLCHKGFKTFIDLIDKFSPKYMFHGHQHLNYAVKTKRVSSYKSTQIINAYGYYIINI